MPSSEHQLDWFGPTVVPSSESLQDLDLTPWQALVTLDAVMRRLPLGRVSSRPVQWLLTEAASVLNAELAVWLPHESQLPFLCVGKSSLPEASWARLVTLLCRETDWQASQAYICNEPSQTAWHKEFPNIRSLLVFSVADQKSLGWLLAANKSTASGFRRRDAALLAPFASLVRLYDHSIVQAQETQELLLGFARSLTAAVDAKDPRRAGHSERTARIAVAIARHLNAPRLDLGEIYLAGLLHDIGKLGLPESLLRKASPWSAEETRRFREHVQTGYTFLADLHKLRNVAMAVLHHHEHYDGSGYPDSLRGEAIPLMARIIAVADAYDALATGYFNEPPLTVSEIEKRLRTESGTKWDPAIIRALLDARDALLAIHPGSVGQSFCQHVCQTLTAPEEDEYPQANRLQLGQTQVAE